MKWILVALTLAVAAPAAAQDVIYQPTAGEFIVKVDVKPQPVDGVATQAVSVFRLDTGAQLGCVAAANDTVAEVRVTVPVVDLPLMVQGRAWELADCSGQQTDSVNTGELRLGPPAPPELLP